MQRQSQKTIKGETMTRKKRLSDLFQPEEKEFNETDIDDIIRKLGFVREAAQEGFKVGLESIRLNMAKVYAEKLEQAQKDFEEHEKLHIQHAVEQALNKYEEALLNAEEFSGNIRRGAIRKIRISIEETLKGEKK
jgi:hypothetical protein